MNDKDLDAFNEWRNSTSTRLDIHDAWQAACEYKQKEIDELEESLATRLAKMYIAGKDLSKIIQNNLINEVQKLQAENAKLRQALEEAEQFYLDD